MDAFEGLSEVLAGFGISLVERTRLTFGAPVLKSLSELPANGKVFVACKGGATVLTIDGKLSDDARKVARFIDATTIDYSKVRPHVANYCKSRKSPVTIGTIRNADDEPIAFTVTRKGK